MPVQIFVPQEQITAAKLNQLAGENSSTMTYDAQDRIATVTDTTTGTVLTMTYDSNSRIASYTDGTNTWTFTYDAQGRPSAIVRTP